MAPLLRIFWYILVYKSGFFTVAQIYKNFCMTKREVGYLWFYDAGFTIMINFDTGTEIKMK